MAVHGRNKRGQVPDIQRKKNVKIGAYGDMKMAKTSAIKNIDGERGILDNSAHAINRKGK